MSNAELLERMRLDLRLRNYATSTERNYVQYVNLFARRFERTLDQLGPEDVRKYQLELIDRGLATNTLTATTCALRFFYKKTIKKKWMIEALVLPRKEKKLPIILTHEEVRRVIAASPQPKYATIFVTMYAVALRLSDVVNIKVTDIDAQRMVITIRKSKGNKDRIVPLSQEHLLRLRNHWRTTRAKTWLFPGHEQSNHISQRSVQRAFEQARNKAGVNKRVGTHAMRHSCATHLLEAGVDIRVIQKLLGHSNIQTTMIYTQVTAKALHVSVAHLRHIKDLM